MCGLLGFCGQPKEGHWGETYRLLTALFIESQVRGSDASGFAAVTDDFKGKSRHRVMLAKAPVPAAQFVRGTAWRKLRHHRCCSLIAHCRFATVGSADRNINNHPHGNPKGKYFLIHNGHIRNWQAIAAQHRLRLKSQCDSEVILRLAERAKHPALGLADALATCDGSMAVVLQDIKHAGLLWLVRNYGSPLWLMRLERRPTILLRIDTEHSCSSIFKSSWRKLQA